METIQVHLLIYADHVCARTQKDADARESGGSRIDARAERIREERV
jgi:hypothetical protein